MANPTKQYPVDGTSLCSHCKTIVRATFNNYFDRRRRKFFCQSPDCQEAERKHRARADAKYNREKYLNGLKHNPPPRPVKEKPEVDTKANDQREQDYVKQLHAQVPHKDRPTIYHNNGKETERIKQIIRDLQGSCPINGGVPAKMTEGSIRRACIARRKEGNWNQRLELGKRPCPRCKTGKQVDAEKALTILPRGIEVMPMPEGDLCRVWKKPGYRFEPMWGL